MHINEEKKKKGEGKEGIPIHNPNFSTKVRPWRAIKPVPRKLRRRAEPKPKEGWEITQRSPSPKVDRKTIFEKKGGGPLGGKFP